MPPVKSARRDYQRLVKSMEQQPAAHEVPAGGDSDFDDKVALLRDGPEDIYVSKSRVLTIMWPKLFAEEQPQFHQAKKYICHAGFDNDT